MSDETLPAGEAVGQYRILSTLGSGGMGKVYLAEDGRLGRKVALKILPSQYTRDRDRLGRFEQEARAASALNHPAILTIYDVGRAAEIYYIATEYIEGETLRSRLLTGNLKLREILDVAIQIASALSASHGSGIVHRDLKPENIMIRPDGFVKVLDFGLAKLTQTGAGDETLETATVPRNATDAGTVLGTARYMSPEQAKGRPVDARSDIFSLGVVLYEMITGRVPFEGETRSHVLVSILEHEPLPLSRLAGEVPHELQRIVSKMLAKNPEERYQVVKDTLIDLKSLRHDLEVQSAAFQNQMAPAPPEIFRSGSSSAPQTASATGVSSAEYIFSGIRKHRKGVFGSLAALVIVAVAAIVLSTMGREAQGSGVRLPIAVADFENLTGEKELDGLSGMMITSLEQSKRLSVMTRSRMFDVLRQKGRSDVSRIDESLGREIAAAENLQALVTASVQKFGELYILDLKVLDPSKNEYIFAAKEQGKGKENIPAMIDSLSEKMRLGLQEKEHDVAAAKSEIAHVTTRNLEAYQHFFIGEQYMSELEPGKAVEELRKAVELDPTFAAAHMRLAYALSWIGTTEASTHIEEAMKLIDQAPAKEQLYIRANKANIDRNQAAAMAIYRQIIRAYPDEKEAVFNLGDIAHHTCDYAVAEEHLRKALELDPGFERAHQHLVWNFRNQARYAEMVVAAKDYVDKIGSGPAWGSLMHAYFNLGDRANWEATVREARRRFPNEPELIEHELMLDPASETAIADRVRQGKDAERRMFGYLTLAWTAFEAAQSRKAIAYLDEALVEATRLKLPFVADLHASKAAMFAVDRRVAEARQQIAAALSGHPSSGGYRDLMFAYAEIGEAEKAVPFQGQVGGGSPHIPHLVRARAAVQRRDFRTAIAEFEQARALNAHQIPRHAIAEAYLEAGQPDKALQLFTSHRAVPSAFLLVVEAKAWEMKGDKAMARKRVDEALKRWKDAEPDSPQLLDAKALRARLG
jgi:serine/threonine protein kinase/tetratricopeptide (TPR) repeat protein